MSKIIVKTEDKIARITINFQEKMNCLDMQMLELLETALTDLKKHQSARVIVITGAGDRAFCTGGNLKEFNKLSEFQEIRSWISYGNEVFNLLENMPMATIAAINGYAMGGGLELALCCDLRIASEDAVLSMPELQHGWVPGWGGLSRLRRLTGESKAKELIMLGERIDAKEALQTGLINKLCLNGSLQKDVDEIAAKLSKIDPFVFEMSKASIMDHNRTTASNDLLFDALATNYSKS
jgi:enoyl-CoA hydratase/carnithine racemase